LVTTAIYHTNSKIIIYIIMIIRLYTWLRLIKPDDLEIKFQQGVNYTLRLTTWSFILFVTKDYLQNYNYYTALVLEKKEVNIP